MALPRINGTTAPIQQQSEINYDPARGFQSVERWKSAGDNLVDKATEKLLAGIGYSLNQSAAVSELVVTSSSSGAFGGEDEVELDTWQLLANEIQKDGRESAIAYGIGADGIASINKALDDRKTLTESGFTGNAAALYTLLLKGSTHFATTQYVLRHTTNVHAGYAVNVADLNVEKIYTTAQLVTEISSTTLWTKPCPARLVYKIENIPAPSARTNYLWGWRKLASTETSAANNRIDITTEYWLELWSTIYYGTVS